MCDAKTVLLLFLFKQIFHDKQILLKIKRKKKKKCFMHHFQDNNDVNVSSSAFLFYNYFKCIQKYIWIMYLDA